MELDAVNSASTEGDQAEEILVMTRISIVAIEEVETWRIVQEEDTVIQDIIQRMRQLQ